MRFIVAAVLQGFLVSQAVLAIPTTARGQDYVAQYVKESKAAALKKIAALKKKNKVLAARISRGGLLPVDKANLTKQEREFQHKIVQLRTEPPPILLDAGQLTVGAVGMISGAEMKVVKVKGDQEAVLMPRLPVYKSDLLQARKLASNAPSGNSYATEKRVGDKDGPPLTVKGFSTKGLTAGQTFTLPEDQAFAVTSPGVVEAIDMEAVKKKYAW